MDRLRTVSHRKRKARGVRQGVEQTCDVGAVWLAGRGVFCVRALKRETSKLWEAEQQVIRFRGLSNPESFRKRM